jgi:Uma2 family endonuclease
MTQLLEKPPLKTAEISRRSFSFAEFEQMSEWGLFADQHVELLNGEIFVKGMQGPAHAKAIRRLTRVWTELFAEKAVVSIQLPLVLPFPPPNFVEPDLALLQLPDSRYDHQNPTALDALLILEISDSTLERDQTEKLRVYARNSIQDYWILNIATNKLEVYRQPDEQTYTEKTVFDAGQAVAPLEFPEIALEWWV